MATLHNAEFEPARSQGESRVYLDRIASVLGRALSRLDPEATSPSHGSFDRTWWSWKFTDFSASRFQEGVYVLAWLFTSPLAPQAARGNPRVLAAAAAAIRFWTQLQHADGSFDEAYPYERSLAATAFTGFYVGVAIERLRAHLPPDVLDIGLRSVDRMAEWLAHNGEHHGILSNHLAAAAAALQVAGNLRGDRRFEAARDRYLAIIAAEQDGDEGWLREYGGADPGYQSHAMFYLAEIWRRTGDAALLERLARAAEFIAWFAHPDGTLGGEYASRGTKFAYPAAFEMLAGHIPAAAAVAGHLRECLGKGRGIGPGEVDAWNLFPLLNNYLFASEAAGPLPDSPPLPWRTREAVRVFSHAGLAIARAGDHVLAAGLGAGGALKLWSASAGRLIYEDCGYAAIAPTSTAVSHGPSTWRLPQTGLLGAEIQSAFSSLSGLRFDPYRFVLFRCVTLTIGRLPRVARWLKNLLVRALIRNRKRTPATLSREVLFSPDGSLAIHDRIAGLAGEKLMSVGRQVPFHMGSARYCDSWDFFDPPLSPPPADRLDGETSVRHVAIDPSGQVISSQKSK
jgi:hypothetical protein